MLKIEDPEKQERKWKQINYQRNNERKIPRTEEQECSQEKVLPLKAQQK